MLNIKIITNNMHTKHPIIVMIRDSIYYLIDPIFNEIKIIVAIIILAKMTPEDISQNNLLNFSGSFKDFIILYSL